MTTISYARHWFPPDVIRHTVWLYLRSTLSYRDVEELLAVRGLDVSYELTCFPFSGSPKAGKFQFCSAGRRPRER